MSKSQTEVDSLQKPYFLPKAQGLLQPLAIFFNDSKVSEIVLNQPQEVFVEKKGEFSRHHVPELHEANLAKLFQLIANENQQLLSPKQPLLSGNLWDGSRIQLVLPPTAQHYTFAIRRKVVQPLTLNDYAKQSFYNKAQAVDGQATCLFSASSEAEQQLIRLYQEKRWHEFINEAIQQKKNMVISGGTSSGKTTFLNACLSAIPLKERLITLEDTREIEVPHENQVNLIANKGEQGMAKIDMQTLVQCCLRLRPDRMIMGEIRGKEIVDFLGACSTGHEGSITSIHANNPHLAFMRMTQMYKQNNVPSMSDNDILRELHAVIDIIVQLAKSKTARYVQSIYYKQGALSNVNA